MEGRAGRLEAVGSRVLKEDSPVERNGEVPLGNRKEKPVPMLDTVLENQDVLQMILMNQETLKDLMVKLLKMVSTIEEKVQAMGRDIGTLSQFTQELNQVGEENNWA
ncbi:hypothetical protein JRQ81_003399 [Phrynocephalus forsythii]|uniref:Uncharacterized protein n=1 Tax=Phrynocephalus forsythii TaxID=171643 RepID=A0A9Q1AWW3_9SAUR|nr:hypothetical protein JRQ81_003399 [Phrynocephalus forsythii]